MSSLVTSLNCLTPMKVSGRLPNCFLQSIFQRTVLCGLKSSRPAVIWTLKRNHVTLHKKSQGSVEQPSWLPKSRVLSAVCRHIQASSVNKMSTLNEDKETISESDSESATEILKTLDKEKAQKLKVVMLEYDVLREMRGSVPSEISDQDWLQILEFETSSQRRKYYHYLRKKETHKRANRRRKELRQKEREQRIAEGLTTEWFNNTIFLRIRRQTMNMVYNSRLAHAMQFGPTLVFDMSFENEMRRQDCMDAVEQIVMAHGHNKLVREPFHFLLTDLRYNGQLRKCLDTVRCHDSQQNWMATVTEKSYRDLFPKERLVYLTPNAPMTLKKFEPDDVYIIGGIVDKLNSKPVTLAKAKEQKIRMARFPLDEYLIWCQGGKNLTLDVVYKILSTLKDSNDWNKALEHVPRRKLKI